MPKKHPRTGFGLRLAALRQAAGLTQQELAEKAGVHPFSISKWELEIREPTWGTVLELAKALGVTPNDFLLPGKSERA